MIFLKIFFRVCLTGTVLHCEEPLVRCPHADVVPCESYLQEREIKAVIFTLQFITSRFNFLTNENSLTELFTVSTFYCLSLAG